MDKLLIILAVCTVIIFFAFRWEWRQLPIRERRRKQKDMLRAARRANQAMVKFTLETRQFQKAIRRVIQDLDKFYKETQKIMNENVGHRSDKWN